MPAFEELMAKTSKSMSAKRAFGKPIESNGTTIIPVAKIWGGGGGGEGGSAEMDSEGTGAGFGVMARPIGAYVVKDDQVTWRPAVDLMRVLIGALVVAALAMVLAVLRR